MQKETERCKAVKNAIKNKLQNLQKETQRCKKIEATSEWFEHSRAKSNGLAIHRLNHSATMSSSLQPSLLIVIFWQNLKYNKVAVVAELDFRTLNYYSEQCSR